MISQADIEKAVIQVAEIVDRQNADVEGFVPLVNPQQGEGEILQQPSVASVVEVINEALSSASGYVEPVLFRNRKSIKSSATGN